MRSTPPISPRLHRSIWAPTRCGKPRQTEWPCRRSPQIGNCTPDVAPLRAHRFPRSHDYFSRRGSHTFESRYPPSFAHVQPQHWVMPEERFDVSQVQLLDEETLRLRQRIRRRSFAMAPGLKRCGAGQGCRTRAWRSWQGEPHGTLEAK